MSGIQKSSHRPGSQPVKRKEEARPVKKKEDVKKAETRRTEDPRDAATVKKQAQGLARAARDRIQDAEVSGRKAVIPDKRDLSDRKLASLDEILRGSDAPPADGNGHADRGFEPPVGINPNAPRNRERFEPKSPGFEPPVGINPNAPRNRERFEPKSPGFEPPVGINPNAPRNRERFEPKSPGFEPPVGINPNAPRNRERFEPKSPGFEPPVGINPNAPRNRERFEPKSPGFEPPVGINPNAPRNQAAEASTLRTERLNDGKENCLERAVEAARPGDNIVMLADRRDPVGHAVVQRKDGSVVDPNQPGRPYKDLAAYQSANPQYGKAVTVSDRDAENILRTPPGAARDKLISRAGLDAEANRLVADAPAHGRGDPAARAEADAAKVKTVYDDAIESGKSSAEAAHAAATELDRLTAANDNPAYVQALVEAAGPTLDKVADTIGKAADNSLDRDKDMMKETMGLLSNVADSGGEDTAKVIGDRIAAELPNNGELQEVDDGLMQHISDGGSTALARAVHDGLRAEGKVDAARGLASNEHGTDLELEVINEARAALDGGMSPEAVAEKYGDYLAEHVGESVSRGESEDSEAAVELMADLADRGGPEVASDLAGKIAEHVPDQSDMMKLDDKLHELAGEGRGVSLSVELVGKLAETGKTEAATELTDVVTRGLETVRNRYEDAQNRVDDLNTQLAGYLGQFGGLLTPEQQEAAINDFKARHAEDYQRLEDAGALLANNMDAVAKASDPDGPMKNLPAESRDAIREQADRTIVNTFPRLSETTAGSEAIADALEAQGRGEPSFMDAVQGLELSEERYREYASDEIEAMGLGDVASFTQGVAETSFKAATLRIATDPSSAERITEGLLRQSSALGVPREQLEGLLDDVKKLATAAPEDIADIQASIRTKSEDLGMLDASTGAGQAMRGFATVLGAMSLKDGIENWGDASNLERIQTVAGALETGVGAFEGIVGVAGKAARFSGAAGVAGGVLGGLGAVLEGISAVDAFRNGDTVRGVAHSATAIGSGVLALASATSLVPGAGVVAAGVLIAVGVGLQQWANVRESNKNEGPVEDFLRGAGLSGKLAEELSNHGGDGFPAGPALVAVAERLGMTGPELTRHLEGFSEGELQRLVEGAVHGVDPHGENGELRASGEDVERIRAYYEGNPNPRQQPPRVESVEGLALWMQYNGYLPDGVTV